MHSEVRETLLAGLARAGAALQQHVGHFTEPFLVWRKQHGQWHGQSVMRHSLTNIFAAGRNDIDEAGREFLPAFRHHPPEFAGMVGFPTIGGSNFLNQGPMEQKILTEMDWDEALQIKSV